MTLNSILFLIKDALSDDDSVATGTPTSSIAATDVTLTPMSDGRMLDTSDHSFGKQFMFLSDSTPWYHDI